MLLFIACALALAGSAVHARRFRALNHPDGAVRPPLYGLRIDHLFSAQPGAVGGSTTFSFHTNNTKAAVYVDVQTKSGVDQIRIGGTVYGGEDSGTAYGFAEGHYRLLFVYDAGVSAVSNGWVVPEAGNGGRLWRGGGPGGVELDQALYAKADASGNAFLLKSDGHRLPDATSWVGRGWLTLNSDHSNSGTTRDFLFVAEPVPATRDACWWRTHLCLADALFPITIGDKQFANRRQLVAFLRMYNGSDLKWQLAGRLLVFYLNQEVFLLHDETYHGVAFADVYSNAYAVYVGGDRTQYQTQIDILQDVLDAGTGEAVLDVFASCPQKCTCHCVDEFESVAAEDTT